MTGDTDPRLHPCPHPSLTPGPGQCATSRRSRRSRSGCNSSLPPSHSSAPIRIPCFTPHVLQASHHSTWKPILFHTTRPASVHASHHSSCELHTTCPARLHASHHSSCELHTTVPSNRLCFTPHILQASILHTTPPDADFASHHTRPVSFTPLDLEADFVSHHSSCKPAGFTPHVL